MRYICEHCGAGGASGRDNPRPPAFYNCHVCDRKECMWPEPIMRKLHQAQAENKKLMVLVEEAADLFEAIREGEYEVDSLTSQPYRTAIRENHDA